ncbi:hypothetical protein SBV1_1970003 [Verrucomicrobia bacterium]|nr:hypothetical protein SBV1_1970003 [Verrucomicrobiota bacterium]
MESASSSDALFFGLAFRATGPESQPEKQGGIFIWFVYPGLPSAHVTMSGAPWAIFIAPFQGF